MQPRPPSAWSGVELQPRGGAEHDGAVVEREVDRQHHGRATVDQGEASHDLAGQQLQALVVVDPGQVAARVGRHDETRKPIEPLAPHGLITN